MRGYIALSSRQLVTCGKVLLTQDWLSINLPRTEATYHSIEILKEKDGISKQLKQSRMLIEVKISCGGNIRVRVGLERKVTCLCSNCFEC
jgi:hypothetical protein